MGKSFSRTLLDEFMKDEEFKTNMTCFLKNLESTISAASLLQKAEKANDFNAITDFRAQYRENNRSMLFYRNSLVSDINRLFPLLIVKMTIEEIEKAKGLKIPKEPEEKTEEQKKEKSGVKEDGFERV